VSARFARCLAVVLQYEGGFVDNPRDSGGATSMGITRGTLGHWLGRTATVDDVRELTRETAGDIYEAHYWTAVGADRLPAGVDLMAFDCAVNQGVPTAARFLQQAAGVPADGAVGPRTIDAAHAIAPATLINSIGVYRRERYRSLPTFSTFGRGWLRRLDEVTALALADAGVTEAANGAT
jgi:lysozyme family protein